MSGHAAPALAAFAGAAGATSAPAHSLSDAHSDARIGTLEQASNSNFRSSKRARAESDVAAAAPLAAKVPPCMLPIELLVDIFLDLSTSEVARAAQVCRTWRAASTDARLWRNLSFSKAKLLPPPYDARQRTLHQYFKTIGARCGNSVESVDLLNLTWSQLPMLAEGLMASAQSLRHIRWSSEQGNLDSLRAAVRLAWRCPQLEMLELRTWGMCKRRELVNVMPCVARPRHFSLTCASISDRDHLEALSEDQAAMFDHATTLEFRLTKYPHSNEGRWMPVSMFARLLQNQAIERLTVHGLWGRKNHLGGPLAIYSVSAPSLRYLDLRWSGELYSNVAELDAPELRELAIDGRLLRYLTSDSLSMLSALTLRLVGLRGHERRHYELGGINSVFGHQGSLKLDVGEAYSVDVMHLFLDGFRWPGLETAEIELTMDDSTAALIAVVAARDAGARGATKQQYEDMMLSGFAALSEAQAQLEPKEHGFGSAFMREVEIVMATASAFHADASASPLCSRVHWKLFAPSGFPSDILDWLEHQPSVSVERLITI